MTILHKVAFFVYLFCSFAMVSHSGEKESVVVLNWQIPSEHTSEESSFIPSLYFTGALFSDSLPQVPVYVLRKRNDVPHFKNKFEVSEKTIIQCTQSESRILEEAGFNLSDFTILEDSEITSGDSYSRFHLIPVRKRNGIYEKLQSFSVSVTNDFAPALKYHSSDAYPESSVLANGEWYRVCVDKDGIYRLTGQNLVELGINLSQVEKSTIQIFGNGGGMLPESNALNHLTDIQENAIWVSGGNSGSFTSSDYILFYGQSPHRWQYNSAEGIYTHQIHYYSNETCYFLTYGQEAGKRVTPRSSLPDNATHTINTFHDYAFHQRELNNILGSGKIWYGETFEGGTPQQYNFSFPSLSNQHPVHIRILAAARSSAASSFTVQALNQTRTISIGSINPANYTGIYARDAVSNITSQSDNDVINVSLNYNRTASGGKGWLGYIAVNARRNLSMVSDQLLFRDPMVMGESNIGLFSVSAADQGTIIWDVTDPFDIKDQQFNLTGNRAEFKVATNDILEFVAFQNQGFLNPRLRGKVPNQNLHSDNAHELVIVVPEIFRQEAERLANFRRENDRLSVRIVSPQQIYNEFSSGVPDISAIRNYMRMFYDRASETGKYPRYLLLFGNGTYDNKNVLGYGGNFIPTFQTQQSLNYATTYISDDFFGLLDENEGLDAFGSLDLGIGRLPVRTVEEARFVVDKLLRYDLRIDGLEPGTDNPQFAGVISNYADWRNVISIIADDEDGNVHLNQSESIANYMSSEHPVYNLEKIYLDAYEQVTMAGGSRYPDVNSAINNRVTQGGLMVNYIGHGGVKGLAHERILTFDDILSWKNFYNLPIFMTATCEFSSFDQPDPNELSAGVRIFLKPDGGAVALFTTTRLAYSHSNFTLNDAFMRNAFVQMENGEMPRLGDLIRIAKVQSASNSSLKNFVLLGDPSMQMAYPKYRAITTAVPDTMKALEKVTIEGMIVFPDGTLNEAYQGVIYPTVFDKKAVYTTLGNDPGSTPRDFSMQNRTLYKGAASITDGRFSFSFVVPRDISYNSGLGKISYYFDDGHSNDGHGYFDGFLISGTTRDHAADNTGPEISLYLNNTSFVSGGTTGPNPILLAHLTDESGINTTGNIGHDIVAFLNGNTANPIILNDFYQADLDSHKSGRVVFPFFNLDKGEYTLTLRAWDVFNNPSVESIDFLVTSAPEITISDLMNFPNPVRDRTTFSFRHNKPATELNVVIDVFNLNGQLVRTLDSKVYASGFEVPIEWDGTDEGGSMLTNGIYLFRIIVSTDRGDQAAKSERLVILR
jgi:hypothetical protein